MKSIALNLLTALALAVPAFAAEKDHKHEKKDAGPNGGRVITAVEPHLEFLVTKDRKVEITALTEDLKTAKLSGQVIAVTAGDRSNPTKLEFKEDGGKLKRITFIVDARDADVLGDEPIWHNGSVIGWVTSGGYAHYVDRSLAQGYVPKELAADGAASFEIEILGERRPARIQAEPLFDPEGARMRG